MLIPLMILFLLALAAIPVGAVCGLIRCIRNRRPPAVLTLILLGLSCVLRYLFSSAVSRQ